MDRGRSCIVEPTTLENYNILHARTTQQSQLKAFIVYLPILGYAELHCKQIPSDRRVSGFVRPWK